MAKTGQPTTGELATHADREIVTAAEEWKRVNRQSRHSPTVPTTSWLQFHRDVVRQAPRKHDAFPIAHINGNDSHVGLLNSRIDSRRGRLHRCRCAICPLGPHDDGIAPVECAFARRAYPKDAKPTEVGVAAVGTLPRRSKRSERSDVARVHDVLPCRQFSATHKNLSSIVPATNSPISFKRHPLR